jgi:hypothetical protein
MTKHFNELTEAEQERLSILAEECAEVIHVVCKILRHGYESTNPRATTDPEETNREMLQREIGDLFHAYDRMRDASDVINAEIEERRRSKPDSILRYLHHQPSVRPIGASSKST